MNHDEVLNKLQQLAENSKELEVVWLYGSRAKNTANVLSDYDLAVAFKRGASYDCEDLAYQWSKVTQESISIVNINHIPVPLAYNIINEGVVMVCQNSLRLHSEQSRIWSLWEYYRYEHAKVRN